MSSLKTKWGKSIAVAMALALTVASVPGADAQAAKKAKLSTKKLTVTVGKKKTIKIKNKVKKAKYTFKSKKSSIAKVSKKGVVTGRKKGTTKITVTEKNGKKTRKLGTVKVTVKKKTISTKPSTVPSTTPSTAPTATAVVSNAPLTSSAPTVNTGAPAESATPGVQTADPTTKPTKTPKPPTPVPTEKPNPPKDEYDPEKDGKGSGWMRLDLSAWSEGAESGDYLQNGHIILKDIELATVPIPKPVDKIGDRIEVLVRGSLPAESEGFRFWLANATNATVSEQYYYTATAVGIGAEAGNADQFKKGEAFQLQSILKHTNHDGSDDMVATNLLLKAYSYGASLDGTMISGIWVRYGDDIGTSGPVKPGVDTPGVETPGTDTGSVAEGVKPYTVDFDKDRQKEASNNATQAVGDDKAATITFGAYEGVNYLLPESVSEAKFKYVTITYTGGGVNAYLFDEETDLSNPASALTQDSKRKHELPGGLPKADQESTVTIKVTDAFGDYDFSKGSFRGIQLFNFSGEAAEGNTVIKSIVFSEKEPGAEEPGGDKTPEDEGWTALDLGGYKLADGGVAPVLR